jgi:hypothetical protein
VAICIVDEHNALRYVQSVVLSYMRHFLGSGPFLIAFVCWLVRVVGRVVRSGCCRSAVCMFVRVVAEAQYVCGWGV